MTFLPHQALFRGRFLNGCPRGPPLGRRLRPRGGELAALREESAGLKVSLADAGQQRNSEQDVRRRRPASGGDGRGHAHEHEHGGGGQQRRACEFAEAVRSVKYRKKRANKAEK